MTENEIISILRSELQPLKNEILKELKSLRDDVEILKIKSELTHRKLDDLTLDVKVAERSIKKDIEKLNDEMETVITVLQGKDILPKAQ